MAIKFTKKAISLHGCCTVEEAQDVFNWLQTHAHGALHFKGLEHLHAAVLQTLMTHPREITAVTSDEFCNECIRQAHLLSNFEPLQK